MLSNFFKGIQLVNIQLSFGIRQSDSRRRQWHPTPVLLPGKSHRRRSLVGCSPWGRWGSNTTERLHFPFSLSCIGEGNGDPLQCSCLENPRDGGTWWSAVYGVAQSWTRLKWRSSSSLTPECGPLDCAFREETNIDNDKIKWHLKSFCCSVAKLCPTFCDLSDCQASLSFPTSWSLLKLMSIESVIPSNYLILCCPLLLLPSIFPSIRVFSNKSALCIKEYWSQSIGALASVLPMNIQGWFPLGLTGWISLLSKGLSRVFSSTKYCPLILKMDSIIIINSMVLFLVAP